jgi:dihydroneopterin aldolase
MSSHTKGKIAVKNLEFHLRKGLYPSELLVENHFRVSAIVCYHVNEIKKDTYLNYERLAEIIDLEMRKDINLLESLAENCLKNIMQEWPFAISSSIVIEKLHPAFAKNNMEAVVVEMEMNR